jgi:hypothetical protein
MFAEKRPQTIRKIKKGHDLRKKKYGDLYDKAQIKIRGCLVPSKFQILHSLHHINL